MVSAPGSGGRTRGGGQLRLAARVPHVGPVPGGGTGVAVYLQGVTESGIAFGWEQHDPVSGQQLAVVDERPLKSVARGQYGRGTTGPWLVVAGNEGVARMEVEIGRRVIRRDSSFALLQATDLWGGRDVPAGAVMSLVALRVARQVRG